MDNRSAADGFAPAPPGPGGADFERLAHAIERLSAARTAEEVIEVVRRSARGLSGARGVAIVMRDGDKCHYLAEDSDSPLWAGHRFPAQSCISGWAMIHRQQVLIPDIYQDDRIPHAAYRPTYVKSLVMTPVGEGEPIAAIGAYWDQARTPTPEEATVLAALARSTATALMNIRLYDSLAQEAARYDTLYRQALQSEHQLRLMVNELNHRVKNSLAMVQAVASQTFRAAGSLEQARHDLSGRIQALARAHDLLTETHWEDAALREVVEGAAAPFVGGSGRLTAEGPLVRLSPKGAICLSLALHELAANAVKYGALSNGSGTVRVSWTLLTQEDHRRGGRTLILDWSESGGPPVTAPVHEGFGMRMLKRSLPGDLNGEVTLGHAPSGLTCQIVVPLETAAVESVR